MASDGMFDNLYDTDVHDCIKPYLVKDTLEDLQKASECLADKAELLGNDDSFFSPFAKGAKEAGKYFMGGKADDIVVIVAQIHQVGKGVNGGEQPTQEVSTNGKASPPPQRKYEDL